MEAEVALALQPIPVAVQDRVLVMDAVLRPTRAKNIIQKTIFLSNN